MGAANIHGQGGGSRIGQGKGLAGALLGLAMAVLAACAPRTAPPAPPPPPPPPVVEAAPVAPPREEDRHKVAILVPLTGPNAGVGQSLANAVNLALADTGSTKVRFTSYDTASGGAGGAASRALAEGATLILGPLLASDVAAVRAAVAARPVPILSFSNDASVAGGPVHVLGYQPAQSVDRVVAHAVEQGHRRFAALVPNGTYGERASIAFTRAVNERGGQVVAIAPFARAREQLPAAARRVTAHDARVKAGSAGQPAPVAFDALLIADSGNIAGTFMPDLQRFGAGPPDVLILGTELWAAEPGIVRVPALHGALFATVADSRFRTLENRYRARFGTNPSRLASLGYDAALLAVSAAADWRVGEPFPVARLQDPKGFAGIDGIFRFRGQVAERGLEVKRVTAGGFVTASPAPTAF